MISFARSITRRLTHLCPTTQLYFISHVGIERRNNKLWSVALAHVHAFAKFRLNISVLMFSAVLVRDEEQRAAQVGARQQQEHLPGQEW